MSTIVHYGVKGMKWGVRKRSINVQSKDKNAYSAKSVSIASGGGGGGYADKLEDSTSISNEVKKTISESTKMIKMGSELAKPTISKLGKTASDTVKAAVRKGKEILKKLNAFLTKTNKKLELEYNKKTLTREQKRQAVKAGWNKVKKRAQAESIVRDRYS